MVTNYKGDEMFCEMVDSNINCGQYVVNALKYGKPSVWSDNYDEEHQPELQLFVKVKVCERQNVVVSVSPGIRKYW